MDTVVILFIHTVAYDVSYAKKEEGKIALYKNECWVSTWNPHPFPNYY